MNFSVNKLDQMTHLLCSFHQLSMQSIFPVSNLHFPSYYANQRQHEKIEEFLTKSYFKYMANSISLEVVPDL